MITQFINILLMFSQKIGYLGILLLMTIESSFIPFPSELIIPPAAYLASQGKTNIFLVILFGVLGSLIGASINYFLAMTLGRKVIYSLAETKFAKIVLIDKIKIKKSEDYFLKYGNGSTFICRLIPGIRQLISIPAGFSKMSFISFLFYTGLGSFLWVIILVLFGFLLGSNTELLEKYYHYLKFGILGIFLFFIFYFIYRIVKKKNKEKEENKAEE